MDVERLSSNIARMVELGGKALAAYLKPRETGARPADTPDSVADIAKTLGHVAEFWLKDPARAVAAQSEVAGRYMDLWSQSLKAMSGEAAEPVVKPDPRDARFKDPQWEKNPFFDFLKQFYLVTTGLAEKFVTEAELDEHLKHKAAFYARQIANALSPSNFVVTNPELLRETISSNAENLVRGMKMFAEDVERGGGDLRSDRQSGHMQVFGPTLYGHLLTLALEGDRDGMSALWIPELNLPIPELLPASYVQSEAVRLEIYARAARCRSDDELEELEDETQRRFGKLPSEAGNFFAVARLRVNCRERGIMRLDVGPDAIAATMLAGKIRKSCSRLLQREGDRVVYPGRSNEPALRRVELFLDLLDE